MIEAAKRRLIAGLLGLPECYALSRLLKNDLLVGILKFGPFKTLYKPSLEAANGLRTPENKKKWNTKSFFNSLLEPV